MKVIQNAIVGNGTNFNKVEATKESFLERVDKIKKVLREDSNLVKDNIKADLKPLFAWPDGVWNSSWSNDNSWSQATFNKYEPHD